MAMKITILCVGKIRERFYREAAASGGLYGTDPDNEKNQKHSAHYAVTQHSGTGEMSREPGRIRPCGVRYVKMNMWKGLRYAPTAAVNW